MAKRVTKPDREQAQKQVEDNFAAFSKMTFSHEDKGKAALLHNGELIEILDTMADAYKMGIFLYKYVGLFSIQEIMPLPVNLGFQSYALQATETEFRNHDKRSGHVN